MQEWQVVGSRGRQKKEARRPFDQRLRFELNSSLPQADSSGLTDAVRNKSLSRGQQIASSLESHKNSLCQSQLLKAVRAALEIAEADSKGQYDDQEDSSGWQPQHVQEYVIWGLGSLISGGS